MELQGVLDPIPPAQPSDGLPCPLVRRAGTVTLQHRIRAPPHQPLEILPLPPGQQEVVDVGVPEPVRVNGFGV